MYECKTKHSKPTNQNSYENYPDLFPDADLQRVIKNVIDIQLADIDHILEDFSDDQLEISNDNYRKELAVCVYHFVLENQLSHKDQKLIRKIYTDNRVRSLHQVKLWSSLLVDLKEIGVEPVLLKGSSVVADYYSHKCERLMADLDLLVAKDHQLKAHDTLIASGWELKKSKEDLLNTDLEHAATFFHKNFAPASVDLHVHAIAKYHTQKVYDWCQERTERFNYFGVEVCRLNPTALLTHTILHAIRWEHIQQHRWIRDANQIIGQRGPEIAWQDIEQFCQLNHCSHRMAIGLQYLKQEFKLEIPDAVIYRLQDHKISLIEKFENEYLLYSRARQRAGKNRIRYALHFIIWRALRLEGGFRAPLDVFRVALHMSGGRKLSNLLKTVFGFLHDTQNRR